MLRICRSRRAEKDFLRRKSCTDGLKTVFLQRCGRHGKQGRSTGNMKEIEIIRLGGTERRLYELVAPLAMDAAVIRWNNGYPFKTSGEHTWYVACRGRKVCGFMPVRRSRGRALIDNYYAEGDDPSVLAALLAEAVKGRDGGARLDAMVQKRHAGVFAGGGFETVAGLTKYDKMTYAEAERSGGDDTAA